MGLLDILNGMQNGPRGPSEPSKDSGGMSPMTMAILALLAYKAVKHLGGGKTSPAGNSPSAPPPQQLPGTTTASTDGGGLGGLLGGGLGDLMKGPLGGALGGLLAGGAAGGALSGGLNDLLKQFQESGHTETANSWVGTGPNKPISPNDLAGALGAEDINALTSQTGLSRDELLSALAKQLPDVVNQLTPDGRLPTEREASRWL
ncbi:YidB family protein [Bradyrhizobium sp. G127]|uniref:YidB family protein n=1 Tax=Bradyrhizobium sp. G127 TaxID=2904800 RepID=UPI001F35F4B5|nr:YidB family protein [Bradyrhizobium sp. G127]MCF2521631.1 YidB family protein [Bradyrhizobium sp. G127]